MLPPTGSDKVPMTVSYYGKKICSLYCHKIPSVEYEVQVKHNKAQLE